MTDPKQKKEARRVPGPKTKRPVIPMSFQISRVSPMRQILDEAEGSVPSAPPDMDSSVAPESLVTETSPVGETSLVTETSLDGTRSLVTETSLPVSAQAQAPLENPRKIEESKQETASSPVTGTRLVPETSLVPPTSLVTDQGQAWSVTRLVPETSLVTETRPTGETSTADVDLFAGLPDVDGYLQIPHRITDHLLPLLSAHSQLVYVRLYRLSWGFNKPFCTVSLPKLAEKTQLSQSTVQRAVLDLEAKGLIRKSERVFGKSRAQGITYEVVTGTSLVPETRLVPKTSLVRETNNKYLKESIKSDVVENPIYSVRKIAARLREINLHTPNYSLERLRADVRTALDGQGMMVDEATMDEALRAITL